MYWKLFLLSFPFLLNIAFFLYSSICFIAYGTVSRPTLSSYGSLARISEALSPTSQKCFASVFQDVYESVQCMFVMTWKAKSVFGSETLVDPNTLILDPDPAFLPNFDPYPGLYYQFWEIKLKIVLVKQKFL